MDPPAVPGASSGEDRSNTASPDHPPPPPPHNTPMGASNPSREPARALTSKLRNLHVREGGEASDDDDDDDDEEDPDEEGSDEELPPAQVRRIKALQKLQEEHDAIRQQYMIERVALDSRYRALYAPKYARRAEIVSGAAEPTAEECGPDAPPAAEGEEEAAAAVEKGVPNFWVQAMLRHEAIAEIVSGEDDVDALKYLTDIRCEDRPDMKGFTLFFHFRENPYFTDGVLRKHYETANVMDQGEPLIEKVEGHTIAWKPRKNLCERTVRSKARKGRKPSAAKTVKRDSFFKFFMQPVTYPDDEDDEDDAPEEEAYNLNYEMDWEIALILRNYLVPDALKWFTGEAVEDDDDDDEDDGEEGGDEEEDEEGDDGRGGGLPQAVPVVFGTQGSGVAPGGDAAGAGAPGSAENPECKQS